MNKHVDIDHDRMQAASNVTNKIISDLRAEERRWDGKTVSKPGVYSMISLDEYHGKTDLLDGPSVSKSALKYLLPAHGGSPKAFWGRWKHNPNHIDQETTDALDFGKAVHCLLLGDEVFSEKFVVRPAEYPDYRTKAAKEWRDEVTGAGKTIVTSDQIARIKRIAKDAAGHPLIKAGLLNGRVERSMFWKEPTTGIWLRARPDAIPSADGVFSDLKTAGKFDEDFLERQIFDACYYLQAAITRMVCRGLGIPFETFTLLYVLNDDVPDTAHVEISVHDIDRGERTVMWCLQTIRQCLDAGEWPGARPFNDGTRHIQMKPWAKDKLDGFLDQQEQIQAEAA